MSSISKKNLYIFIDESGNFDFSPKGTSYFALTAISTTNPLNLREEIMRLKYRLLAEGYDLEYFHATEDKQEVRDFFFDLLETLDDFEIDCVLAQKNKANPSLYINQEFKGHNQEGEFKFKTVRQEEKFYEKIAINLLQYIFKRYDSLQGIEKIIVVLDSPFTKKKREYILKILKSYLKKNFNKPFYVYFHRVPSDFNCQLADYCGWAIFVNAERNETRPHKHIESKLKSCFDIFQRGSTLYY